MRPCGLSADQRPAFSSTDPRWVVCARRLSSRWRLKGVVLAASAVIAAQASGLVADETESPELYEIVVSVAVPVLPPPVRVFFETHIEAVVRSATSRMASTTGPDTRAVDSQQHYIMLDVAAVGPSDRHAAALSFPHDRAAAERLFARVKVPRGGLLPWVVGDQYRLLVQAFASTDAEAITRHGGLILHFATDASLPFNTTRGGEADATNLPPRGRIILFRARDFLGYDTASIRSWFSGCGSGLITRYASGRGVIARSPIRSRLSFTP